MVHFWMMIWVFLLQPIRWVVKVLHFPAVTNPELTTLDSTQCQTKTMVASMETEQTKKILETLRWVTKRMWDEMMLPRDSIGLNQNHGHLHFSCVSHRGPGPKQENRAT